MDVLITGSDTDLGRTIAQSFSDAGHHLVLAGRRADELEVAAKELDVDGVVMDTADPVSLAAAVPQLPSHLDVVINVPSPTWTPGDARVYSLADHAAEWRGLFDAGLVSTVLTAQLLGDQLRSGGSIITVISEPPQQGSAAAAVKAAVADWTASQADHFGVRGITINAVAAGRGVEPGYAGLSTSPPSVSDEIARLALFLATPAARHITGQTLHVTHGALVNFG